MMRNVLRKILAILDGTPAEYGRRSRGQSVLEMAFLTPLLVMLIAGIAEVAWYANNYLILLEVSRVGARRGTVLLGDFAPLSWDNRASLAPGKGLNPTDDEVIRVNFRQVCQTQIESNLGFYNQIVCVMLNSLDPLPFRNAAITGNPEIDEIVVSAFSVQIIDNSPTGDIDINARAGSSIYPTGYQAVVVGRYPFNANECTIAPDGSLTSIERDPFDYIPNTAVDDLGAPDFEPIELPGLDVGLEPQRGFVWFGQHQVSNPNVNCLGSEFSIADVEGLMNVPTFGLADDEERSQLPPGQGIVLVEMFWEHDLLLDFPVFSPVFNVLGENPSISVWAAFPVPSIEPKIRFS